MTNIRQTIEDMKNGIMPIFVLDARAYFIIEQTTMIQIIYWWSGQGLESLSQALTMLRHLL